MLEAMRRGIGTWFAKIFIGLLVLSFAVWGIADIFGGYGEQNVATVGEIEVPADEYQAEFQREMNALSNRLGRRLTLEEARRLRLDSQILLRLVGDAALQEQARKFGVGVAGEAVVASIRRDPIFRDSTGKFSEQRFYRALLQNNLTEQALLLRQLRSLIIEQVTAPVARSVHVPNILVKAANTYRNETRNLEYFTLPLDKAGSLAEPTDEQLRDYYNNHKSEFRAPEYRSVSVIDLSPSAMLDSAEVSEDAIKDFYERNKERYGSPERREVLQVTFPDLETAKEAHEKLNAGADFVEIGKGRDLTEKDVKLGLVTKSSFLDEKVGNAIFALPEGVVSEPIEGDLSTVIAKVVKVEAAVQRTLEDERDAIRKQLAAEEVASKVLDVYDSIEDERAAGVTLEEVAKKLNLAYLDIAAVDRQGNAETGKTIDGLAGKNAVLSAIFTADVAVETDPVETSDRGFVWYEVRKVTPERQKELSEAREDVVAAWKRQESRTLLARRSQELIDQMRNGEAFDAVASQIEAEIKNTGPVKRSASPQGVPPSALEQAFALQKGDFGAATLPDQKSRIVFRVADITQASAADAETRDVLASTLERGVADDVLGQYVRALRETAGVSINDQIAEAAVTGRLVGRGSGGGGRGSF